MGRIPPEQDQLLPRDLPTGGPPQNIRPVITGAAKAQTDSAAEREQRTLRLTTTTKTLDHTVTAAERQSEATDPIASTNSDQKSFTQLRRQAAGSVFSIASRLVTIPSHGRAGTQALLDNPWNPLPGPSDSQRDNDRQLAQVLAHDRRGRPDGSAAPDPAQLGEQARQTNAGRSARHDRITMNKHCLIRSTCPEVMAEAIRLGAHDQPGVFVGQVVPQWRYRQAKLSGRIARGKIQIPGGSVSGCLEIEPGATGVLAHLSATLDRGPLSELPPPLLRLTMQAWAARKLTQLAQTVEHHTRQHSGENEARARSEP